MFKILSLFQSRCTFFKCMKRQWEMFKILSLFQSRFTFFRSGQCKYLTFIYLTQYYFSLDLPFFIVFEVAFHFSMNVILILQECQGETLTEMYFSCP